MREACLHTMQPSHISSHFDDFSIYKPWSGLIGNGKKKNNNKISESTEHYLTANQQEENCQWA